MNTLTPNQTEDEFAGMPSQLVDAILNGNIGEVDHLTKGTYPFKGEDSEEKTHKNL